MEHRPRPVRRALSALAIVCALAGFASADTPESRGKAILQAQLAAVKKWSDPDPMVATFAKGAVVLLPQGEETLGGPRDIASGIAFLNPHSTVKEATYDHFTAGGNASVAWFGAELHFTVVSTEPGYGTSTEKHTVRAIELLDGSAGWKVAVAAFTNVAKLQEQGSCEIEDKTEPGPLAELITGPHSLARALAADAIVFGTDPSERGAGASAKALVASWHDLGLSTDLNQGIREIHNSTYGYAMMDVHLASPKLGKSLAMSAFLLALPGPDNTWSVVALSYGATF